MLNVLIFQTLIKLFAGDNKAFNLDSDKAIRFDKAIGFDKAAWLDKAVGLDEAFALLASLLKTTERHNCHLLLLTFGLHLFCVEIRFLRLLHFTLMSLGQGLFKWQIFSCVGPGIRCKTLVRVRRMLFLFSGTACPTQIYKRIILCLQAGKSIATSLHLPLFSLPIVVRRGVIGVKTLERPILVIEDHNLWHVRRKRLPILILFLFVTLSIELGIVLTAALFITH